MRENILHALMALAGISAGALSVTAFVYWTHASRLESTPEPDLHALACQHNLADYASTALAEVRSLHAQGPRTSSAGVRYLEMGCPTGALLAAMAAVHDVASNPRVIYGALP